MKSLYVTFIAFFLIILIPYRISAQISCAPEETKCLKKELVAEKKLAEILRESASRVIDRLEDPVMKRALETMYAECESASHVDDGAFLPDGKKEKLFHDAAEMAAKRSCYENILLNHFVIDLSAEEIIDSVKKSLM